MGNRTKFWGWVEKALFVGGVLLLAGVAGGQIYWHFASHSALNRFNRARAAGFSRLGKPLDEVDPNVDFSQWNPKRVVAYKESLVQETNAAVAVLRIPRLNIEVPVFDGTDDLTLNRGVGRILGTAKVGDRGNTGLAGHRDGFFRGLKDIALGDELELTTGDRAIHYVVEKTVVVEPDDVSVLADSKKPELTLVTCFPFYFVGNAPHRFIVRASSPDFDGLYSPSGISADRTETKEKTK